MNREELMENEELFEDEELPEDEELSEDEDEEEEDDILSGYPVVRSRRKDLIIEITTKGRVLVKAPYDMDQERIDRFVKAKDALIKKHLDYMLRQTKTEHTAEEMIRLKQEASEYLPGRVEYFSKLMNLHPAGITINYAKNCFGSCTLKNNLSFSCYLMEFPPDFIDCIVVHQLAHLVTKKHDETFYNLVEKYIPRYRMLINTCSMGPKNVLLVESKSLPKKERAPKQEKS